MCLNPGHCYAATGHWDPTCCLGGFCPLPVVVPGPIGAHEFAKGAISPPASCLRPPRPLRGLSWTGVPPAGRECSLQRPLLATVITAPKMNKEPCVEGKVLGFVLFVLFWFINFSGKSWYSFSYIFAWNPHKLKKSFRHESSFHSRKVPAFLANYFSCKSRELPTAKFQCGWDRDPKARQAQGLGNFMLCLLSQLGHQGPSPHVRPNQLNFMAASQNQKFVFSIFS